MKKILNISEMMKGKKIPWYLAGSISEDSLIAVYAPKGAVSYAASKINLINPGTYDCIDTDHAPDWDTVNGWKFDGISQYLDTEIDDNNNLDSYSMFIRFSNLVTISNNTHALCGLNCYGLTFFIGVGLHSGDIIYGDEYGYGSFDLRGFGHPSSHTPTVGGIRAVVGHAGYLNGNLDTDGVIADNWSGAPYGAHIFIGCMDNISESPQFFSNVYIQAFALYNTVLSSGQVLAITQGLQKL